MIRYTPILSSFSISCDLFTAPQKLTDNDTIVLADFTNTTGDPVFDDTLRQGLSVEIQQSPFLSLISDRQVQQTLALMGQPKEARPKNKSRPIPTLSLGTTILRPAIFSSTASPKPRTLFSELPNASWGKITCSDTTSRC